MNYIIILALLMVVACVIMLLVAMQRLSASHKNQISLLNDELERLRRESAEDFRHAANESLIRNAEILQRGNSDSLRQLLSPLQMRIEDFNDLMTKSVTDSQVSRRTLSDQIERLSRLNMTISRDTRNLADALKGNNRVQGAWGETLLETLLEKAGLKRDVHFRMQVTRDASGQVLKNDEGDMIRPDAMIMLPDDRIIIIDSKVSLSAYIEAAEAPDHDTADQAARRHVAAVKRHIDQLSAKAYHKNVKGAAEFVLMFIPNDGALMLAHDTDPDLWEYALNRKISPVSPAHLLSTVQLVAQMWRRDAQDRNAAEIARVGGLLYDSAVALINDFKSIENQLDAARRVYDTVQAKLSDGPRSIRARAERLRELGAKATKTLK